MTNGPFPRLVLKLPLLAVLLVLVVVMSGAAAPEDQEPHGILDGKIYRTEMGKKNNAKGDVDEIVFQRGLFRSATAEERGFLDAPYEAAQRGSLITFQVKTESVQEGTMAWQGKVLGDQIEGTVSSIEENRPVEYWFRGALKH
jgi:hypothetical protein